MTLSITCPQCGRQFSGIKVELAGKQVRCGCGQSLRLPEGKADPGASRQLPRQAKPQPVRPSVHNSPRPLSPRSQDPFELHYSDLDEILSRPEIVDRDFDPTRPPAQPAQPRGGAAQPSSPQPTRKIQSRSTAPTVRSPAGADAPPRAATSGKSQVAVEPDPAAGAVGLAQPGSVPERKPLANSRRLAMVVSLAMFSATLGLAFALFLISARVSATNQIWEGQADVTLRQINSGQFGFDPTTANVKLGFQIMGWLFLVLAVLLIGLALLQMLGAGLQLFAQLSILRWVDGVMAMLAVTMLFLLIGALFLHGSHIQQLLRQVNQASVVDAAEEPANLQRLRAQYRDQADDFRWGIAALSVAPAALFGSAMLRLLGSLAD